MESRLKDGHCMCSSVLVPAQPRHYGALGDASGTAPSAFILCIQGRHLDLWQLLFLWVSFPLKLVTLTSGHPQILTDCPLTSSQ